MKGLTKKQKKLPKALQDAILKKNKSKKVKKEEVAVDSETESDEAWWNSFNNQTAPVQMKWDSGYGEYDIANADSDTPTAPTDAKPGEVGYAPQGKIGNM